MMKTLSLIGKIIFFTHVILGVSFVVHPKGPTHRSYAIKCLEQVTKQASDFIKSKARFYPQLVLTYVISKRLHTPGYEIQQEFLTHLHNQRVWTIEILQHRREDFHSYSENCVTEGDQSQNCVRKNVLYLKSHLYIIIVDGLEMFDRKLGQLKSSSTFDTDAIYIIYYTEHSSEAMDVVLKIMSTLYRTSVTNVILLIPKSITEFAVYLPNVENRIGTRCFSQFKIKIASECIKGELTNKGMNIFKANEKNKYMMCYRNVQALVYEPFVITETSGIEIEIIHEIGKVLNISFRIETHPNASINLGEKSADGAWTGFLEPIFSSWHLGIGNIPPEEELMHDFIFTVGYYWVQVVLVVPIAALIPRWRVLTVIFTTQIWGICIAVIFGFAIAFYIFKYKNEVGTFRTFQRCLGASYQLFLAYSVPRQPKYDIVRVFFISMAFFAIIMNSVYTSSLIYYLQNPIREHQIATRSEVVNSNLTFGGAARYKEMFKYSSSPNAKRIYEAYLTVDESQDTYIYWLKRVATEKNITTIAIKLNVQFLISSNNLAVTDKHGNPKVFIIPSSLRTQPTGIIMRKGNFMANEINFVIQRLILEAGLVERIKSKYVRLSLEASNDPESTDDLDDDDDQNEVSALSPHHLEGAFAILALGEACGCLVFMMEIVYYYIVRKYFKKKTIRSS